MNPPHFQDLQQAYVTAQHAAVHAGHVRTDSAGPEVHAALNRLMWVSAGLLVAAVNTAASVGLLFL